MYHQISKALGVSINNIVSFSDNYQRKKFGIAPNQNIAIDIETVGRSKELDKYKLFGYFLDKLMTKQKLTKKDLIRMLNCSRTTLNRWLNNSTFPDKETQCLISQKLNVQIDDLLIYQEKFNLIKSLTNNWDVLIKKRKNTLGYMLNKLIVSKEITFK